MTMLDQQVSAWNVLLVDDEEDVLEVSRLVLEDLYFDDRPLNILTARSGREARTIFESQEGIALAFIDVVMETEHAGLDLVKYVRQNLGNDRTRLILRTGNPGAAPEREIVRYFEIDDYKEKTELTADRLGTAVMTSLRSYRNLIARLRFQEGLQRILETTLPWQGSSRAAEVQADLVRHAQEMVAFACAATHGHGALLRQGRRGAEVLTGIGRYAARDDGAPSIDVPHEVFMQIEACARGGEAPGSAIGRLISHEAHRQESFHLWLADTGHLSEDGVRLLGLWMARLSSLITKSELQHEVVGAQTEVLHRLCEAVESRSKETGSHIRRIALYSQRLAQLAGLGAEQTELIVAASPLHDIGKVSVPDHILNKPGKLDDHEWAVMQRHAEQGYALLTHADFEIMQAGAEIAWTHHEKWDGSGYPRGLAGRDIPLAGRIVAIVDVFDALLSRRAYKAPWPVGQVLEEIQRLRGTHFDPELVDLLLAHGDDFHAIFTDHPD